MEEELLRSLWQTSREDHSVLAFWDEKKHKARKEVIGHLVQMMSSVRCPEEGESTSNLYRILVRKLRGQISNFHEDPEQTDEATKKIAKWIEGLIKEAYYRKQGKIKPRVPESEYLADKAVKKEIVQEMKVESQLLEDQGEDKKLIQEKAEKIDEHQKKARPTVLIDGIEYVLKKVDSDDEEEKKVAKPILKATTFVDALNRKADEHKKTKTAIQIDNAINLGEQKLTEGRYEEESHIIIDNNKRVVLVKPFKKYLVDRNILVLEDTDKGTEGPKKKPPTVITSSKPDLMLGTGVEHDQELQDAGPLIRNWSGWMLNITKKAKDLISWENSNLEHRLADEESGVPDKLKILVERTLPDSKKRLEEEGHKEKMGHPSGSGSDDKEENASQNSPRKETSFDSGKYTYYRPAQK